MVSSCSSIFSPTISAVAKLTGEFASLEEPADDSEIVIVLVFLADGYYFVGSKRRIEPKRSDTKV
jgi:hypothetical protein